jgi:hypothetical protein
LHKANDQIKTLNNKSPEGVLSWLEDRYKTYRYNDEGNKRDPPMTFDVNLDDIISDPESAFTKYSFTTTRDQLQKETDESKNTSNLKFDSGCIFDLSVSGSDTQVHNYENTMAHFKTFTQEIGLLPVTIFRPWFSGYTLFNVNPLYVQPNLKPGYYSNAKKYGGKGDDHLDGIACLIPVKAILCHNQKIIFSERDSTDFSLVDTIDKNGSVGAKLFGINLDKADVSVHCTRASSASDSLVTNIEISHKGVAVMGFLCQTMPYFPNAACPSDHPDRNLAFALKNS